MIPLDEVFVQFELTNDVVARREDEGVGLVVISSDKLIVTGATVEGIGAFASIEDIVTLTAFNEVIVSETKDEVVSVGADKVNTRVCLALW